MSRRTFEVVEGWGSFPADLGFSEVASVSVGSRDRAYLLTRKEPYIIVMERDGSFVKSWGHDILSFRPHGITVGPNDTVYCVDEAHQLVYVFSSEGVLLDSFGTGEPSDTGHDVSIADFVQRTGSVECSGPPFNHPTALAVGPDGSLYVADGYGNARVHHFSPDRELIRSWGDPGSGPGEFRVPHGLTVSGDGRVLVADRENDRIQVFDHDGGYIDQWTDVHRPTDITMDADGYSYVAEFPSTKGHHSWRLGRLTEERPARISILDPTGKVVERFGCDGAPWEPGNVAVPHALALDSAGALYVAEVISSSIMYKNDGSPDDNEPWSLPEDCHCLQKFERVV